MSTGREAGHGAQRHGRGDPKDMDIRIGKQVVDAVIKDNKVNAQKEFTDGRHRR